MIYKIDDMCLIAKCSKLEGLFEWILKSFYNDISFLFIKKFYMCRLFDIRIKKMWILYILISPKVFIYKKRILIHIFILNNEKNYIWVYMYLINKDTFVVSTMPGKSWFDFHVWRKSLQKWFDNSIR